MHAWWKWKVTTSYVDWAKKSHHLESRAKEKDLVQGKEGWFELDVTRWRVWGKRQLIWHHDFGDINYKTW
jgi:hypothetical protein